jgi:hypothetical protein
MIVDCVERELEVYLDGVCIHAKTSGPGEGSSKGLTPPGMEIDNFYSIGGELSLFDDLQSPSSSSAAQGLETPLQSPDRLSLSPSWSQGNKMLSGRSGISLSILVVCIKPRCRSS